MSGRDAGERAVRRALDVLGPVGVADRPLGALTTYRVGGTAAVGATVSDLADVARVASAASTSGLPVLVVGRGSNLLVADAGFRGIAVLVESGGSLADLRISSSDGSPASPGDGSSSAVEGADVEVVAGAAVPLPTLARRCARAGVRGLEWTVGVPGSVGGGIRMNAGGHGADMAASVRSVRVADLSQPPAGDSTPVMADRSLADLAYGYRRSSITATDLVVEARFAASGGSITEAEEQISDIVRWRREHQPGGQNAGSVFTNPAGDSAGRLIDEAGLKGRRRGTAEVSPKHANFIQADAGGSADDVRQLIDEVRAIVADRTGVELHTEIRMIGFEQDIVPGQPSPSS